MQLCRTLQALCPQYSHVLFDLDHGNLSICHFTGDLKELRRGQTSAIYVDIKLYNVCTLLSLGNFPHDTIPLSYQAS